MAKTKADNNQKPGKKVKRERKVRRERKLRVRKEKKEKIINDSDPHDELIIDGLAYKTFLTNKYLNKKKYQPPDPNLITAFIPGTILKIFVKTGRKVMKGDDLLILEAMKMNNKISAPHDAVVKKIHVKSGEMVARNQLLIELKE